jgi:GNAT superfamily N-acetyltransferase
LSPEYPWQDTLVVDTPPPGSSISDVHIRESGPEDRDFIIGLVPELLAFGPPSWRDPRQMTPVDVSVIGAAVGGRAPDSSVLVAEDGRGRRLGFVHVTEENDYYAGACGHIGDLVVAREVRGRGVGTVLLAAAERWARTRGYRLITLNVFIDNAHARSVYERAGYAPETIRHVKVLA